MIVWFEDANILVFFTISFFSFFTMILDRWMSEVWQEIKSLSIDHTLTVEREYFKCDEISRAYALSSQWAALDINTWISPGITFCANEELHGFYTCQYPDSIPQLPAHCRGFLNFLLRIKCDTWHNPCINVQWSMSTVCCKYFTVLLSVEPRVNIFNT